MLSNQQNVQLHLWLQVAIASFVSSDFETMVSSYRPILYHVPIARLCQL